MSLIVSVLSPPLVNSLVIFEIVPWQKGDALEAACRCFTDWFDSRGGAEAGEVQAAISQVRLFIEHHGDSRFEPIGTQDRPVNNRAGWRKGDGSEREWLIPSETWKSEVAVGHDPQAGGACAC